MYVCVSVYICVCMCVSVLCVCVCVCLQFHKKFSAVSIETFTNPVAQLTLRPERRSKVPPTQ